MSNNLIEVKDLRLGFPIRSGVFSRATSYLNAVDGVSLNIKQSETFGLVGESGCGKTTFGRCLLMLLQSEGSIFFNGIDLIL